MGLFFPFIYPYIITFLEIWGQKYEKERIFANHFRNIKFIRIIIC